MMDNLPDFLVDLDPDRFLSTNYIVFDTETTNYKNGLAMFPENSLVLTCWSRGPGHPRGKGQGKCYGSEYDLAGHLEEFYEADVIVAHNAKFDLQWLARAGIDLRRVLVYDTMIGEYVIAGNRRVQLTLDATAKRYGRESKVDTVSTMISAGVCPSTIPREWLTKYCHQDVKVCEHIFLRQRRLLKEHGLLPVQFTRCLLTPALADIEMNGMVLDKERVYETYNEYNRQFLAKSKELDALTGGINWRSPKQVAEYLYDVLGFEEVTDYRGEPIRTKTGNRATDSDTIDKLKIRTEDQRRFVELKQELNKLGAALSKSLEFFKGVCDEQDCKFFAQFNQTVTRTHRLSSSGIPMLFSEFKKEKSVQFQNMDRNFKKLFRSRHDGWLMAEADGAQLEFRVGGFLGQDAMVYYDITHDVDIHQFTADTLTAAGQPTNRQEAKAHTFKPLYGGNSGTNAEKEYYSAFREKYRGLYETQRGWVNQVLNNKFLQTPWGLRYYWPDTRMESSGYVTNTQSIFNYPVQALATAEIIPIAVVYLWHRSKDMQMFIVNTIHDSVICEIPPDEQELFKELSVQCFTHDVYNYLDKVYNLQFNFPLGTGCKIGEHWSEGEEIKTTVESRWKLQES